MGGTGGCTSRVELRFNAMITYYSTLDSRVAVAVAAAVVAVVVLSAEFYGPRLNALT